MESKFITKSIVKFWKAAGYTCCNKYKSSTAKKSECEPKKMAKDLVPKDPDSEELEKIFPPQTISQEGPMKTNLISGLPENLKNRLVKISKPPKNSMQSGTSAIKHWQLTFDTKERWQNPLMGWCSSGDSLSNLKLLFSTKDEAIAFCEKNGWRWFAAESPKRKKMLVKSYRDNFVNKRTRVSTK